MTLGIYFSDAHTGKNQGRTAVEMSTSPVELCLVRVSFSEVTQLVTEIKQKEYYKQRVSCVEESPDCNMGYSCKCCTQWSSPNHATVN